MKTLKYAVFLIPLALIYSCNSNHSEKELLNTAADTVSASGLTGDAVMLIKTASIDFKVNNVFDSAKRIANTARSMNGVIINRHIESIDENSKRLEISDDSVQVISSYIIRANMLVRVPTAKLDQFIEEVSATAAYIQNSQLHIEDKSLDYLSAEMKKQNRRQLLKNEAGKNHKTDETITLADQTDQLIEQQIQNKKIDADVNYSTIQLSFFQNALIRSEVVANNKLSDYRLPFAKSMNNAFFNGWNYFLTFIIAIANLWMFIVAGIMVVFSYRYYKVRKAGS
ncbi:DUF4349 domain-containing protein [Pedobacter sp. P351]|uniref:DUF4349 domain-containing protein n=1 Tax=Pedobacter superstes TaxID=3133441 RepID=UPI0030A2558F